MSVATESKYVWVMEWTETSAAPPRPNYDVYSIEPKAGVRAEDFEKFMTDEMFPVVDLNPVDTPATERRYVVRHYLLKQIGDFGADQGTIFADYVQDQSAWAKFVSLSATTATHFFHLVGSMEIKASRDRE
jgi:hypothetical protein